MFGECARLEMGNQASRYGHSWFSILFYGICGTLSGGYVIRYVTEIIPYINSSLQPGS